MHTHPAAFICPLPGTGRCSTQTLPHHTYDYEDDQSDDASSACIDLILCHLGTRDCKAGRHTLDTNAARTFTAATVYRVPRTISVAGYNPKAARLRKRDGLPVMVTLFQVSGKEKQVWGLAWFCAATHGIPIFTRVHPRRGSLPPSLPRLGPAPPKETGLDRRDGERGPSWSHSRHSWPETV